MKIYNTASIQLTFSYFDLIWKYSKFSLNLNFICDCMYEASLKMSQSNYKQKNNYPKGTNETLFNFNT